MGQPSQPNQTRTPNDVITTKEGAGAKLVELLKTFSNGIFVTHGGSEDIHSRPMAIAQVEPNGDVWMLSGAASDKVREVKADARAQIVCQSSSAFVTLTGRANVNKNRAKLDELWNDSYKSWFPQGKDDPNLVLIQLRAEEGEWWDERGLNRLKYVIETVKAYATGTTPKIDDSQHGRA
jgi:general stress protein 26